MVFSPTKDKETRVGEQLGTGKYFPYNTITTGC